MTAGPASAILFDWGGTLAVHVEVELLDLWRAAARHLDPDHVEAITERLVRVEARSWARTTSTMRSARLMDLLREASDELEMDVAEAVLDTAHDAHLGAWTPNIRHHQSAAGVLTTIREAGLPIGLLSNTHWPRAFHEQFLQRDGLDELIDERLYTSELDHIKPHEEPFLALCRRLDVVPGRCVFVGDRPVDDIEGARGLGMRTVWIRNDHTPGCEDADAIADATIDALADLPDVLASWGALRRE